MAYMNYCISRRECQLYVRRILSTHTLSVLQVAPFCFPWVVPSPSCFSLLLGILTV